GWLVGGDRLSGGGPVTKVQTQVAPISAERLGPDDLGLAAEQYGLAIADAKRRQHLDLMVQTRLQFGEGRGRLDPNGSRERIAVQPGRRIRLQALLQLREPTRKDGEPGRHGMSAKPMQQWRAVMKAVDEVEALDAASGPTPLVALRVEDKGWPIELLHQAARREAQHAQRPVGRTHHDYRGRVVELDHLELRLTNNLRGELLALRVLILESLGQRVRGIPIVAHQQLKGQHRILHPAGSVDARPQLKGEMLGGYGTADAGHRQQGRTSGSRRLIQSLQSGPDDGPVFAVQRDHVSDGPERDRVQRE